MYKDRHIRVERECEWCGEKFMARQSSVKSGHGRFCSLAHANEWQRSEGEKGWGYENGKSYWGGEYWIVRWYDENGQHTTPYPRWWWTINVGEVPEDYYVSYKDENPKNIDPSNFICIPAKDIRARNTKRHVGMKRSDESKKKMSLSKLGKHLSDEHKNNIGKSVKLRWERGDYLNTIFTDISGDKNPGWRGGAGTEYPVEFNRQLKRFIWERDNSMCQICGTYVSSKGVIGHVHHIDGYKENNELDNLILLCIHCHGKIHKSNDVSSPVIMAFRSKLHWNQ